MTDSQRVHVDELVCASTEFCIRIAPQLFHISEATGKAVVKNQITDATLEALAEEAQVTCPTGAITVRPADD